MENGSVLDSFFIDALEIGPRFGLNFDQIFNLDTFGPFWKLLAQFSVRPS